MSNANIGRRVRLIYTDDEITRVQPGDEGTVTGVDGRGTMFVDWDRGSGLGLIPGLDEWEFIDEKGGNGHAEDQPVGE